MEKINNKSIIAWLNSPATSAFCDNKLELTPYLEADYLSQLSKDFPFRLRVVFSEQRLGDVEQWLQGLAFSGQICLLTRQNSLLGIEIALKVPADIDTSALLLLSDVESFWVDKPLTRLNEPGLLVMDMDSTAIEIECIDELAKMAGVGQEVSEVTAQAMRGELDFEQSLRARVSKLKGASADIITQLCATLPIMPGLEDSLAELKSNQWRLVVASGGFTPFVNDLKHKLGLNAAYANELVIDNNVLQGEVVGTVVDAQFKAKVVAESAKQWQIPQQQTVAIGDGANDIAMLEAAELGLAFHAKPKLVSHADIAIQKLDLRALVFCLQA